MGGRPEQAGVAAADADGVVAVDVDGRDELRVDLADEHHPGDVDGLGVGDAQPVAELGGLAEAAHQRRDLRTAAVDDDRAHADEAHQHDVLGEDVEGVVLGRAGDGVAAVLDDDGLAGEAADVRQRLDEDVGARFDPACERDAPVRASDDACRRVTVRRARRVGRPAVSSRPRATLAAWTAPPDAPLVRLSRAHSTTT